MPPINSLVVIVSCFGCYNSGLVWVSCHRRYRHLHNKCVCLFHMDKDREGCVIVSRITDSLCYYCATVARPTLAFNEASNEASSELVSKSVSEQQMKYWSRPNSLLPLTIGAVLIMAAMLSMGFVYGRARCAPARTWNSYIQVALQSTSSGSWHKHWLFIKQPWL